MRLFALEPSSSHNRVRPAVRNCPPPSGTTWVSVTVPLAQGLPPPPAIEKGRRNANVGNGEMVQDPQAMVDRRTHPAPHPGAGAEPADRTTEESAAAQLTSRRTVTKDQHRGRANYILSRACPGPGRGAPGEPRRATDRRSAFVSPANRNGSAGASLSRHPCGDHSRCSVSGGLYTRTWMIFLQVGQGRS
jgi:hypothetical protein